MYSSSDPIGPGDRAPDFSLPSVGDGAPVNLYTRVRGGVPLVMFYPGGDAFLADRDALNALAPEMAAHGLNPFVVVNEPNGVDLPGLDPPFFTLRDAEAKTAGTFGLDAGAAALTLRFDPNLRLTGLRREGAAAARHFLDRVAAGKSNEPPKKVSSVAPVLIIPHVLSPDTCRELIRWHHEQGNRPSTVTYNKDGKDVREVVQDQKVRHDHWVRDAALNKRLDDAFARRVNLEVAKAFQFDVAAREPFRIVRYEAEEKGHFAPHRDNVTPTSAHMRFAVTLNLNPDDYDGGYLRFPEYSDDYYAPPLGGAVVFSCSHLHEATEVTRGTRYALLTFLFGADDARQLQKLVAEMSKKGESL